jgi:hypothetical protein
LVIELRIRNINEVHGANAFLVEYIPKFNEQFAVLPENIEQAYSPLSSELNLELILCVKETRTADNGGVFSFNGKLFKITDYDVKGKSKIAVVVSATNGIMVQHKDSVYDVLPFIKPAKVEKVPRTERWKVTSTEGHCWKSDNRNIPLYSSELTDPEIYKMLNDIFLSKYA